MTPTFRQLRYFEQTVNCGSLTEAAKALNVSQSAISLAIKDLELYCKARLLERHHTGVGLTEMGKLVYNESRKISNNLNNLKELVNQHKSPLEGEVNMGISMSGLGFLIPSLLKGFRAAYPNISLQVTNVEWPAIQDPLHESSLDFGIVSLSSDAGEDIKTRVFKVFPRRLIVHGDNPLAFEEPVSISQLKDHDVFVYEEDTILSEYRDYLADNAVLSQQAQPIKSTEAMRNLVMANMGVGILSELSYLMPKMSEHNVHCQRLIPTPPPLILGSVMSKHKQQSEAAIVLHDYLYNRCISTYPSFVIQ